MKKIYTTLILLLFLTFSNGIFAEEQLPKQLRAIFPVTCVSPGLANALVERYEAQYKIPVKMISLCTGDAIDFVKEHEGVEEIDVMMGHDRDAEERFVQDGFAVNLRTVCLSEYVLVGPKEDPAKIKGMKDAVKALKKIAKSKAIFCSRADSSGTHGLEMRMWKKAGINPKGDWYLKTKVGTSETLIIAARKKAYFISHYASYAQMLETIDLIPIVEDPDNLYTEYEVLAISPERFPNVDYMRAMHFIAFLTSPDTQKFIGEFGTDEFGRPPFKPLAVTMSLQRKGKKKD
jgi:tungstate transport system substrate-binding protein